MYKYSVKKNDTVGKTILITIFFFVYGEIWMLSLKVGAIQLNRNLKFKG